MPTPSVSAVVKGTTIISLIQLCLGIAHLQYRAYKKCSYNCIPHPTATKQPSEECLVHGIFVNQNLKCCTLSYKPLRVSLRQKSLKRVALGCKVATARNGDQETDEHRHPMGTEMSGHNTRSRVPSPRCL